MSTGVVPSLINLLATTGGRDKACRLIQYLMRLTATRTRAGAEGAVNKAELIQRAVKMESLGGSMAMTRKVLRFGRPIGISSGIYKTISDLMEGKIPNAPKAILSVLSSLCLMLFFLFDHYLYFERLGLCNNPSRKARYDYLSNLFWLLECIFGICKNVMEYLEVRKTYSKSELKKKQIELIVDNLRNLLDIPIAVGFLYEGSVSSSKMGFLGTITSLIGLYQIWK